MLCFDKWHCLLCSLCFLQCHDHPSSLHTAAPLTSLLPLPVTLAAAAATAHHSQPRLQTPPSPSSTEWPIHPFHDQLHPLQAAAATAHPPSPGFKPTVAVIH
ncbi:MAG: hypothetical protein WDW38_000377 [Sanguina aurantia]